MQKWKQSIIMGFSHLHIVCGDLAWMDSGGVKKCSMFYERAAKRKSGRLRRLIIKKDLYSSKLPVQFQSIRTRVKVSISLVDFGENKWGRFSLDLPVVFPFWEILMGSCQQLLSSKTACKCICHGVLSCHF